MSAGLSIHFPPLTLGVTLCRFEHKGKKIVVFEPFDCYGEIYILPSEEVEITNRRMEKWSFRTFVTIEIGEYFVTNKGERYEVTHTTTALDGEMVYIGYDLYADRFVAVRSEFVNKTPL